MAGTCHHRSLTDDTKHQVALNTYELDVFSIAGLGGLCPPNQNPGGLGGSAPQPKPKIFRKFFRKLSPCIIFVKKGGVPVVQNSIRVGDYLID